MANVPDIEKICDNIVDRIEGIPVPTDMVANLNNRINTATNQINTGITEGAEFVEGSAQVASDRVQEEIDTANKLLADIRQRVYSEIQDIITMSEEFFLDFFNIANETIEKLKALMEVDPDNMIDWILAFIGSNIQPKFDAAVNLVYEVIKQQERVYSALDDKIQELSATLDDLPTTPELIEPPEIEIYYPELAEEE